MVVFLKFVQEFLKQFFSGFVSIILGIVDGIKNFFNFSAYKEIMKKYIGEFNGPEWVLTIIFFIIIGLILAGLIWLIIKLIRKIILRRSSNLNKEEMLDELANLHNKVIDLNKEKEEILAMKVSQLGLSPAESATLDLEKGEEGSEGAGEDEALIDGGIRFPKLHTVDTEYQNYKVANYGNTFTLEELCETFRQFAASRLGLYYTIDMMRLFISSLGAAKLVILQGISGTGKTSLAYAWGKFVKRDSCVASVQPSWRDRTELFGYFNEFTKKFNETDVLKEIYEAGYTDDVYTVILDEMNIARVEYYFAEMLSILEMPDENEWVVELVSSEWKKDPVNIKEGKLKIAPNVWYIGTINNDDSTFMVTDKVYDRAMPIDINEKGQVFEYIDTPSININYSYLKGLYSEAIRKNPISEENLDKIRQMDDYVIEHFRIAFGNRILKQLNEYVPIFVECGGTEIRGIDYFMAKKVLRKFEQLNVVYIRDEIDGFIDFLNKTFGKDQMKECIEYCLRLKKLS